jgi:hypothetical protein
MGMVRSDIFGALLAANFFEDHTKSSMMRTAAKTRSNGSISGFGELPDRAAGHGDEE